MITAAPLSLSGIVHGFFTREGGHSPGIFASLNCGLGSGDDVALVTKNRAHVAKSLGVAETHLLSAYQVHSPDVLVVDAPFIERPKVDGLVTATRGLALGILTADCGPVLFADEKAGVIGACHAGWKGAVMGVTDSIIAEMEKLGARRSHIVAVLGPTISQKAYEVGPEFPAPFLRVDEDDHRFFIPSVNDDHFMFDLPGYLTNRLKTSGVGQVHDLALCTYGDEQRFFSYRRATHRGEADYGRLISAIALKDK
jgi:YfiH family protein